ncbi:MAG: DUF4838 domain-containing protein [bacterium]|nr:DUF4838 domain-containing protein [bacterium]
MALRVGVVAAAVCVVCFVAAPVAALTVAEGGRARLSIVHAADAIPAERTAARELADYLGRITGGSFEVIDERDAVGPTIEVGATVRVREQAPDLDGLPGEAWVVRSAGVDRLLLYGGRPRGALYAVYRFLEDELGVRWWTPFEEAVPHSADLSIGQLDRRGRPAFEYRDVHGIHGPREFCARNRLNGHYSKLTWEHGGSDRYGPPWHVHNFFHYVPPDEFFDEHPEYYSEIEGERDHDRTQLCLTDEALVELVGDRMLDYIAQAQREASERNEPAPRRFGFSHNDWGDPCACVECSAEVRRLGAQSGTIVEFVNRLADRVGEEHPQVLLDTLAYYYSFDPPQDVAFRDNVALFVSALQYRDFSRPLSDAQHDDVRRTIETWAGKTRHLYIWDYIVTFGGADLPLPNLSLVASDLRYYRDLGVEGVFVQHDHPIAADMRDLKVWVLLKLLEDPSRDVDELVLRFTDGFYGRAAPPIRRYLDELSDALRQRPSEIGYPARAGDYDYLDLSFVSRAHRLFDKAEKRVRSDPVLLRRVRHARLSLDRATLLRMVALGREWQEREVTLRRTPPRPEAVAARYRATWIEQLELRISDAASRERLLSTVERELRGLPGD